MQPNMRMDLGATGLKVGLHVTYYNQAFLADYTLIMVELLAWLSSVCHGCIVAKWCKIGPRLLLITNRKLHIGFYMT